MLNSGAPGVMIDLEDSMANQWERYESGIRNVLLALTWRTQLLRQEAQSANRNHPSKTVAMVRARGLHLSQRLTGLDAEYGVGKRPVGTSAQARQRPSSDLTAASLYDVARITFGDRKPRELKHPLTFYIPKTESAAEAEWWSALFKEIARKKGWSPDFIKCFALVESHPLAYQIEEFLYRLKDHILGLNLGRWDYMASLIHFNLNDPDWVLPDRNTIPHDVKFFPEPSFIDSIYLP